MDPRDVNVNVNVGGQGGRDDGMNLLAQSNGCFIKQKMELLEIITGCETKNRYDVSLKINNAFYMAFHCKEISNCCCRNFCPSEKRAFQMDIKYCPNGVDCGSWALIDRPFQCTCYCCCRPEMNVKLRTGQNIGRVTEPWGACSILVDVFNSQDQLKYQIDRSCCEAAIMCRNDICGAMTSIDFPILATDPSGSGSKLQDGNIERKGRNIVKALMDSDADCFDVVFPRTATPEEKLLIITTVLMLDFRYFEETKDDDKHKGINI